MKVKHLTDFLMQELKNLYSVEEQIVTAMPKMIKEASNSKLKEALNNHFIETKNQLQKLDMMAENMKISMKGYSSKGIAAIIKEGSSMLSSPTGSDIKDTAIITAAQFIEHYEIAGYGCAAKHAEVLGLTELAEMLQGTLHEEIDADKKLSSIAEGGLFVQGINEKAAE